MLEIQDNPEDFQKRKDMHFTISLFIYFFVSSSSLFPPVPKGETSGFSAEGLIQPSFFRAQTNSELCHRETVVVDGAGSRRFHYLTPQHLFFFYPGDMMRPLLARRRQLARKTDIIQSLSALGEIFICNYKQGDRK